jgi:hypothetical protein
LFRFEFVRSAPPTVPTSHIQVHAHRDAIAYVMTRCGTVGRRAKRRSREMASGTAIPRLADLHFPTGGNRFRPCLEDVLQMLILELGVDAEDGWQEALAKGRQQWRLNQIGASVRDSPETAARVLRELGYDVSPPASGVVRDRSEKLHLY